MENNNARETGRILFSGGMQRVADNLMNHVSEVYEKIKCAPTEEEFHEAIRVFCPHVIVICLKGELGENLEPYEILEEEPRYKGIRVIIIGKEEDCDRFTDKLYIEHLTTFLRPLNTEAFFDALGKCVEEADEIEPEEISVSMDVETSETKKEEREMTSKNHGSSGTAATLEAIEKLLTETSTTDRDSKLIKQIKKMAVLEGRQSILVVDDDVQMLNVIKLYLQDLYDITVVPSGKLALKFLEKKKADLVLLDYMMPEMDGPEVLRQIRENERTKNLPVIFLTGVAEKHMVFHVLGLKPEGYLLKPVTREVLLERVTEILLKLY